MADIIPDSARIIILQTCDSLTVEVARAKDKGVHIVFKKQKAQNPVLKLSVDGYRQLYQVSEAVENAVFYLSRQEDELKRRRVLKEKFDKKLLESKAGSVTDTKQDHFFYEESQHQPDLNAY